MGHPGTWWIRGEGVPPSPRLFSAKILFSTTYRGNNILDESVRKGDDEIISRPEWLEGPYRTATWWEMHQFSGRMIYWLGMLSEKLKSECLLRGSGVGSAPYAADQMQQPISDEVRKHALITLEMNAVDELEMPISYETLVDIRKRLESDKPRVSYDWLMAQVGSAQKLIEKEMKKKVFLYLPTQKTRFLPVRSKPDIFGDQVAKSFPSAGYDICEAGMCVALGRGTAAVFHLMRVLEIGLTVFGAKFGVSLAHTNWAPALDEIKKKVGEMHKDPTWKTLPDCKEQQEFYSQAASHFEVIKNAWRNYTMHARGKYTEEEAERIFDSTCAFMQKISENLSE